MSDKYWRMNEHASRTAWEYCEPREYVIGYIIKRTKKRRDWLVFWYRYPWDKQYLGILENMGTGQAKQTAQLLIGAQK